jgi:hypothetical protein
MEFDLLWRIAVVAAVALLFVWRLAAASNDERQTREHMLDEFLPRIDHPVLGWSTWRYRRIDGQLDGRPVRVDLVPDTLVPRALPTLWVQIRWAQAHDGELCVTADPVGAEFFSDDGERGERLRPPTAWRRRTEIRGLGGGRSLLHRLADLDLEDFPAVKQITITRSELKVTLYCARGERQMYRVLRAAKFPPDCVSASLVEESMAVVRTLQDVLDAEREAG